MSDLSDAIDPHWNINGLVIGARCVGARLSHDHRHLNLYIESKPIEIPNPMVSISDTAYGIVASTQ